MSIFYKKYYVRNRDNVIVRIINHRLVEKLHIKDNQLKYIIELHKSKLDVYELIHIIEDKDSLILCAEELTEIEFKLQDAWGFDRDINFHMFWRTPKCTCPKLDNKDRYPYGYYILSGDCPLHYTIQESK